jgi:hypothetical protein
MATVAVGPFSVDTEQDKAIIAYFSAARNKSAAFREAMGLALKNTATLESVSIALTEIQTQFDRLENRLQAGVVALAQDAQPENKDPNADVHGKLSGLFGGE